MPLSGLVRRHAGLPWLRLRLESVVAKDERKVWWFDVEGKACLTDLCRNWGGCGGGCSLLRDEGISYLVCLLKGFVGCRSWCVFVRKDIMAGCES